MPPLVLGAVQFGLNYGINNRHGKLTSDEIVSVLELAWQNGVREIDTAQDYGDSEVVLAECLKRVNRDFVIHSKFILKEQTLTKAIDDSLARLNVKKLGYFYFHRFEDYLRLKNKLPDEKSFLAKCNGLAVSLYDEDELQQVVEDSKIKAIQLPLNLFDCSDRKLFLIQKAQESGKKIYIRSVFLQGLFLMNPEALPSKLVSLKNPLEQLQKIAAKNQLDMKAMALGFVKSVLQADGILIGVDNEEQLAENLSIWETTLSEEIICEIRNISIVQKELLLPKNW